MSSATNKTSSQTKPSAASGEISGATTNIPTDSQHPAILANCRSVAFASAGDKSAWLALYADDAVLRDPVGVSLLDPDGLGHRGKAAIATFWDNVIGPANISLTIQQQIISGDRHCAALQQVVNTLPNGEQTTVTMLASYAVDAQGLITEMSAYWDMQALLAQMTPST